MSPSDLPPPPLHATTGLPTGAASDSDDPPTVQRHHHQERLTRLFRHTGDGADDRYLLNLMMRYRGIKPS